MLSSALPKRLSPRSRHRAPPVPQFPLLGGRRAPPGIGPGLLTRQRVGARWLPWLRNCR